MQKSRVKKYPEVSVNAEKSDETLCSPPVPYLLSTTFRRRQNVFAVGLVMMLVTLHLDYRCFTHCAEKAI